MPRPPLDSFIIQAPASTQNRPPLDSFFSATPNSPKPKMGLMTDIAGQTAQGIVKGIPNTLDMGGAAVATLADKAMGSNRGWGDTFTGYANQRPVSNAVDAVLGTKEREAETTLGRYANAGGQALGTLGLGGIKAAASIPMMARAFVAGSTGAAASDVGAPVGGFVGELAGGEDGRQVGEAIGGLGAGLGAAMYGDKKLTKVADAFTKGFKSNLPVITPKTAALQKTKTDLYQAAEKSGTVYEPSKLRTAIAIVENDLKGYNPDIHTGTKSLIKAINDAKKGTSIEQLDNLRQMAYKISDPQDALMAKRVGAKISEFMDNNANLAAGSPKEGILLNRQARDANKVFEASRISDDLEREVKMRARGTTAETAATNFIRNLADDEMRMKFLSPDVQKVIEKAAITGNFQRALKMVGALGPNRLIGAVNLGASVANPMLLAGNAVGIAAQIGEKGVMRARTNAVKNALRNEPNISERTGRAMRDLFGVNNKNSPPPSPFEPTTNMAAPTNAITRSPMPITSQVGQTMAQSAFNNQSGRMRGGPAAIAGMGLTGIGLASLVNNGSTVDRNVQQMGGESIIPKELRTNQSVSATHTIKEEGYEPRVYNDSRGFKTVGIGFNMQQDGARDFWKKAGIAENFDRVASGKQELSQEGAEKLFNFKHQRAGKIASGLVPNFSKLGENQRAALEGMVFQLGAAGAKGFKNTLAALGRNNPEAVMYGVMRSAWAKQTPARAKRAALMLAYDLAPQEAEKLLLEQGQIAQNELKYVNE